MSLIRFFQHCMAPSGSLSEDFTFLSRSHLKPDSLDPLVAIIRSSFSLFPSFPLLKMSPEYMISHNQELAFTFSKIDFLCVCLFTDHLCIILGSPPPPPPPPPQ